MKINNIDENFNNYAIIISRQIDLFTEKVEEIYVYINYINSTIEVRYNNDIKFNINLEKLFFNSFRNKTKYNNKNFFLNLIDISIKVVNEENIKNKIDNFYTIHLKYTLK